MTPHNHVTTVLKPLGECPACDVHHIGHARATPSDQWRTNADLNAELERLRRGLRQIVEGDYPADAGNAETWAEEILHDSHAVDWTEQ